MTRRVVEQGDAIIRNARVIDGSGAEPAMCDVVLREGRIVSIGTAGMGAAVQSEGREVFEADGLTLSPGFVDTHTHDDTVVIGSPEMLPKLSQGVTTVVVGNCGISAAPVTPRGGVPDPMNLLGGVEGFRYPTFAGYVAAVEAAAPAVNVAALVGHTALRSNCMDRLDRAATPAELERMRGQLREALTAGALGLSTGLAYGSANAAPTEEVLALAEELRPLGGLYATHLRSESAAISGAIAEALRIGREAGVPVVISHLKCAGVDNWGRSGEVLAQLDAARLAGADVAWDCYPYAASSSTLDLGQVDERVRIVVTWSGPHPEMAGHTLAEAAAAWAVPQQVAAGRLQPAGAIYFGMAEEDVRRILRHPVTMIGSDGLPHDPRPHPRLWGSFTRVLGRCCREEGLFSLPEAIHKMTGAPADRFGLRERGLLREGYSADLVLFDAEAVRDAATFDEPRQTSEGIRAVWVNGVLSWYDGVATGRRSGRFLAREGAAGAVDGGGER